MHILAITLSMHLLGSAILFGVVSGPYVAFASPLLSVFGWFFLIPELCGVSLQWYIYDSARSNGRFWLLMLASVLSAATLMGVVGPKEQGNELRWVLGYALAGGASAAWSPTAIRLVAPPPARPNPV